MHVYCEREKPIQSRSERFMDVEIDGRVYHPNITSPRDRNDVKKYVKKEGDILKWPEDWCDEVSAKKRNWEEASKKAQAGMSLRQIHDEMPGFVAANLKKMEQYIATVSNWKKQDDVPPLQEFLTWVPPGDITSNWSQETLSVWNALKDNLTNKGFGRRQLYLHGPTGIGKSTFLQHLMACLRVYVIPAEDFYDLWDDQLYDLSVMEEFKSQKTIQWFNQWLDGAVMNVRKKGSQALKTNPVPTLVLSNFDINGSDVYPNMQESVSLGTLRRRFQSVAVTQEVLWALTSALRAFLTSAGKPLPVIPTQSPPPIPEFSKDATSVGTQPPTFLTVRATWRQAKETVNPLWPGQFEAPPAPSPPLIS